MKTLSQRLPLILSALALVVALTMGGAVASGVLVTSKQIKDGTIVSQDLKNNGVKGVDIRSGTVGASDIGTGAVKDAEIATDAVSSSDIAPDAVTPPDIATSAVTSGAIADGAVTAADVSLPAPEQTVDASVVRKDIGRDFDLIDEVTTYTKQDASSLLQVDWNGSAAAGFATCVFQLRVDGLPGAQGAGETFVPNGATDNMMVSGLFSGLDAGPHRIEVWVKTLGSPESPPFPCTIGPANAGVSQTFIVSEQVI